MASIPHILHLGEQKRLNLGFGIDARQFKPPYDFDSAHAMDAREKAALETPPFRPSGHTRSAAATELMMVPSMSNKRAPNARLEGRLCSWARRYREVAHEAIAWEAQTVAAALRGPR